MGDSYRTAIFYFDDAQKQAAKQTKTEAQTVWDKPIVTEITPATYFYPAEDYHQKFAERTGHGMCHIPYAAVQ